MDVRKYEHLALKADSSFGFGYIVGATEQMQIDLNAVELALYNAVEIGDVSCKDIKALIESINKAIKKI